MRRILRIHAVLTIFAVCAAGAFAVESMEPGGVQLSDGWLFHPAVETGEPAIVDPPDSLEMASPAAPDAAWSQIELGRSWFEQGFNPQRAGWYRCRVKLPPELLDKVLSIEIRGRRTGEAVYFNGKPVGAHNNVPADFGMSYLAPPSSTEDATLVLRLDAPGLERPALDSVLVQAAAMLDYITPVYARGADGKLQFVHRSEGLDFFPQEPVALGNLRVHVAEEMGISDKSHFAFCWVIDFPCFEWDADEKRYVACHHPFTSPMLEDMDKLESDTASVRARAYDIVLNGVELGGGSVRIHTPDVQQRVFNLLGIDEQAARVKFGFL